MKYVVIEESSGNQVKPGMKLISHLNEIYAFNDFKSPRHAGSTGRVHVTHCETAEDYEFYPGVFGLKIVEQNDDPFNN